jgi:hypothetical protein
VFKDCCVKVFESKQTHKQAAMDPGGGEVPARRGGAG